MSYEAWRITYQSSEQAARAAYKECHILHARIDDAPVAIMDTRDVLGLCAPTEDAFPALYALQGHRVRLVLDDVPNAELSTSQQREEEL